MKATGETGKKAVLFDLDGTLIDTTDLILKCFEHSWRTVRRREHQRQALVATFGMPLEEAMRQLLLLEDDHELEDGRVETVARLLAEYRAFNEANHDAITRPFAGARPVIEALGRRGYRIGVVTSKGRALGMRGLRLCGLAEVVDTAIFLEDTTVHKPRPEPILEALDRMGVPGNRAAYVGDSTHDLIAGRCAGVRTVAALWGPWPRHELKRQGPDYMAESFTDLLDIFE